RALPFADMETPGPLSAPGVPPPDVSTRLLITRVHFKAGTHACSKYLSRCEGSSLATKPEAALALSRSGPRAASTLPGQRRATPWPSSLHTRRILWIFVAMLFVFASCLFKVARAEGR